MALSELEMNKISENNLKIDNITQSIKILRLELQLEGLQKEEKIKNKMIEHGNATAKRLTYINKIKKAHGIKAEKFGYDPLTGEIDHDD